MALFLDKWGDIRGSVSDITFSRNRGGAYIRSKVTPMNPQSEQQQNIRSILTEVAGSWLTLDDNQRAGWEALADREPYTDVFGNKRKLTGIAIYIKANTMVRYLNKPMVVDAPENLNAPAVGAISLEVTNPDTREVELTYTPTLSAGQALIVSVANNIRPSVMFVRNLYRIATTAVDAQVSPWTITLPARFGDMTAGNKVCLSVYRLLYGSGGTSLAKETTAIIP